MNRTIKLFLSVVLGLLFSLANADRARAAQPLDEVLHDMQGAPLRAVELTARDQAQNNGPRFRSAPAQVPFYQTFEGDFVPQDANTKLAIFSDDGCDVWIDGVRVHRQKDHAQNMLNLTESLHPIAFTFVAGRTYRVRVDFSNVIYLGQGDMDGVTLFVYTDTTPTPTPTATPTVGPTPTPTATPVPQESWGRIRVHKEPNLGLPDAPQSPFVQPASLSRNANGAATDPVVSTTATTVGGQIYLTFEIQFASNETIREITGIEDARWGIVDRSSVNPRKARQILHGFRWLGDYLVERYFYCNGAWHPFYLYDGNGGNIEKTLLRYTQVIDTSGMSNGPHEIELFAPLRDEVSHDLLEDEHGEFIYEPIRNLH